MIAAPRRATPASGSEQASSIAPAGPDSNIGPAAKAGAEEAFVMAAMIPCRHAPPGRPPVNHLAHARLAAPDEALMFGGLIADFLRGAIDPSLPPRVQDGVRLHRAIDRYTDAHPEVAAARALFEPPLRRYAGVVLDLWFDHLLARDWNRYGVGALEDFSREVQRLLVARETQTPPRMQGFVRYLLANDLPRAYVERATMQRVFEGVSHRIARANPLADALAGIESCEAAIRRHFDAFMPDLIEWAKRERALLASD